MNVCKPAVPISSKKLKPSENNGTGIPQKVLINLWKVKRVKAQYLLLICQ
jgi:hypothetical protein